MYNYTCTCIIIHVHVHVYMYNTFHSPELDQTQQVRRWTLARGEGRPCNCLPQLWPAVPSTAGYWGTGQTEQATS